MKRFPCLYSLFIILCIAGFIYSCEDSNNICCPHPGENYSHTLAPGHSATDFLSDSSFTQLVVEIDYMEGYKPDAEALDALQNFLQQRLHKTSITLLEPTPIPAGNSNNYTADDIRALETQYRDTFTQDQQLAAYIIITDGKYAQDNILGIAYYNTSTAFFGQAYDEASGGLTQVSRYQIEATSFQHEFGHLLGLVNIKGSGTTMQTPHQDEDHGNHCTNQECLMYYALESADLFGSIFGGEVPTLGQSCIDDLQANGGE